MGATLPVAIHLCSQLAQTDNQSTPISAYAMNTTGGLAGALCCAFALLPWCGITTTLAIASGINFGIATLFTFFALRTNLADLKNPEEEISETPGNESPFLNQLSFISGMSIIILEVAWTRYFNLLGGSNTYIFSLVLVFTLAGLSIAAWLVRDASKRFSQNTNSFSALALMSALGAISVVASVYVMNLLPEYFQSLLSQMQSEYKNIGYFQAKIAVLTLYMNLIILLPGTVCGTIFPLILNWKNKNLPSTTLSKQAATRLAYNTAGCVLGYVILHFLFNMNQSFMGASIIETCFLIVAATYSVYSIILLFDNKDSKAKSLNIACLILVFLVVPAIIFKPHWPLAALTHSEKDSLRFYKEGPNSVVSVDSTKGLFRLKTNGKTEGSLPDPVPSDFPPIFSDMPTQVLLGLLPPLLSDSVSSKGLVIGMGTGTTCGTAVSMPTVKECTVIEIEPAVYEASKLFASSNHSPWNSPKYKEVVGDARHYLAASKEKYDWITSQPGEPSNSGSADLYTREFFQMVKSRLASNGIFAQWIQLYGISPDDLKSLIGTFYSVFPNSYIIQARGAGEIILIQSPKPIEEDTLRTAYDRAPRYVEKLYPIGINNAVELLADIISFPNFRELISGKINTDDNLLIENSASRAEPPSDMQIANLEKQLSEICFINYSYDDKSLNECRKARKIPLYTCGSDYFFLRFLEPQTLPNQIIESRDYTSDTLSKGNYAEALSFFNVSSSELISPANLSGSAFCEYKLNLDPKKCLFKFEQSLELNPLQYIANFYAAKCHYKLGNIQDALYRMKLASQIYPVSNLPHIWVCAALVKDGQLDLARQNLDLLKKRSLKTSEEKSSVHALTLSIDNKSTPETEKIIEKILLP